MGAACIIICTVFWLALEKLSPNKISSVIQLVMSHLPGMHVCTAVCPIGLMTLWAEFLITGFGRTRRIRIPDVAPVWPQTCSCMSIPTTARVSAGGVA